MKILLVGSGAREHAIAKALVRSPKEPELYSFMSKNNPGIAELSKVSMVADLDDFEKLKEFIGDSEINFAVIGPEAPLEKGIVDFLSGMGVPSVGPTKSLARLETSKAFTRELFAKYNIPGNAKFKVFTSMEGIKEFLEELGDGFVVKPDGLTGGKGVKVSGEHLQGVEDTLAYCEEVLKTHSSVIIEEKFVGEEFSLQCFVDGKHVVATPPVQDHKRAFVNDSGPNCYSEDTEILTENGWKTFDKIKKKEKVMTFDLKKKELKFKKPNKIYWMKYNGKMIHFKHRELDLLVTPNHRMVARNRKTKRIKVLSAENFIGENEIPLSGIWKGNSPRYFIIDEYDYKFNRKHKQQKISFLNWIRFMGLFLSEGCVIDRKKEKRVIICQTKKSKHFKKFEKILSELPFKVSYEEKHNRFRINSVQLVRTLDKFGTSKNKFVPEYIKNAKKRQIIEFLNSFALGDGSIHQGRMRFHSASKRMIDDIQELIVKIGKSGIITVDKRTKILNPINKKYYKASQVYSLEIKPETVVGIRKNNIKKINYNGFVGCVNVSTGFVVVRRNKRVSISGNTGGMGSYSCSDHLLPFLKKEDIEAATEIVQKTCDAIREETGQEYKGIMYGGFIVTKDGIGILEYNARLGDPEAMNTLTILKTDLVDVCQAIVNGTLNELSVEFENKATVCKYAVPEGYPDNPVADQKIDVSKVSPDALMFFASINKTDECLVMSTSRAMGFVGASENIEEAEQIAEKAVSSVEGPVFHREDIGTKELLDKRVKHMEEIRGN
ncbi:MAG: hypothetical protein ISS36_03905 [Candidatus Aenigmarchaeota archaeon]|nr:hypothetical protein [Candidatus Aenigmarchaeota archaeon]